MSRPILVAALVMGSFVSAKGIICAAEVDGPAVLSLRGTELQEVWPRERKLIAPKNAYRSAGFALGQDGTLIYTADSCNGKNHTPVLKLAAKGKKATKVKFLPEESFPKSSIDLRYFTISSRNQFAAFTVSPCPDLDLQSASRYELRPAYVAIVDLKRMTARALGGSLDDGNAPLGAAMETAFSPDEKYLLVNYETGFMVYEVTSGRAFPFFDGGRNKETTISTAIGWLSSQCVVFSEAKDWLSLAHEPPLVLNWRTGRTIRLTDLYPKIPDVAKGIDMLRYPLAIQILGRQLRIISLEAGATRVIDTHETLVADRLYVVDSGSRPTTALEICGI